MGNILIIASSRRRRCRLASQQQKRPLPFLVSSFCTATCLSNTLPRQSVSQPSSAMSLIQGRIIILPSLHSSFPSGHFPVQPRQPVTSAIISASSSSAYFLPWTTCIHCPLVMWLSVWLSLVLHIHRCWRRTNKSDKMQFHCKWSTISFEDALHDYDDSPSILPCFVPLTGLSRREGWWSVRVKRPGNE